MKSKLPLLIVMAILCSFSCIKSKEMPAEKLPVKMLTRTIQVEGGSTSFTNYTYDGTVLSAIEYTYPSATKSVTTYPDKTITSGYIYAGDQVSEIHDNQNGKNTYTNDSEGYPITLISTFTNSSGQKVGEARYTFEYEMS